MKRTKIAFDAGSLPEAIRPYVEKASVHDSSCSETAKTLFVQGETKSFLKIGGKGSLEREYRMTEFLSRHRAAPVVMAYETDGTSDYLLTEAIEGEDGTATEHLEQPERLAAVFGESLRLLHSIPIEGCPYPDRTSELLDELRGKAKCLETIRKLEARAGCDVIMHGDYCLPNIILDRFAWKGFVDLGYGGMGDRHYDLYWGIWTLGYNLKSDRYMDRFLDAYGRADIDAERLVWFTQLIEAAD